jgi:hypothetical protein
MRCQATVHPWSLRIRSRTSPTDDRCLRQAMAGGLCYQHAAVANRERGRQQLREARLRAEHRRIVDRIRAIPVRP